MGVIFRRVILIFYNVDFWGYRRVWGGMSGCGLRIIRFCVLYVFVGFLLGLEFVFRGLGGYFLFLF